MASRPPHVLVLPFPAQGHIIPLMELSRRLAGRGFRITFVNTDFNHERIVNASSDAGTGTTGLSNFRLVSIPDGLAPGEDRNDIVKFSESMLRVMPGCLEQLMRKMNESGPEHRIAWLVADQGVAWAFGIAKEMGIRVAAFWPAASTVLATMMSLPRLIEEGILDDDGTPRTQGMIKLSPDMMPMDPHKFPWNLLIVPELRKMAYELIVNNVRATKLAEFIVSNTFQELEPAAFAYMPNILPIGPLISDEQLNEPTGQFWAEDAACINWLNEQPANSVIYVAFGSIAIINRNQFQELALGLERSGRPFLWVVRPGLTDASSDAEYPAGFRDRVSARGRIVNWSPQQKVLAHPSVACFVTHCGWNSTMEGVRNGVPFLCWPYFADQFLNQNYICDVWKIGYRLTPVDIGVISSEQIKSKVEELLGDDELKMRSLKLKEMAYDSIRKGGSSFTNMNTFIEAMKN